MAEKVSSLKWFGTALKALLVLADHEGRCPSGQMAEKLESKSLYLRKVLTHLVKAGLIHAKEGRDGGYSLAERPENITLAEVYEAMRSETISKGFLEVEGDACFSPSTTSALCELRNEMEGWIVDGLEQKTLADLLAKEKN
ncbi:RrF2 family transcriptional regulator [Thalassobacillus hwangdonensis]|uniref:RrF2 family transcriptional regulator n=1 Tax=Thalassobacillus hwangdonensis TaxID=546108 RepID=A0ABW3L0W4_9BACI